MISKCHRRKENVCMELLDRLSPAPAEWTRLCPKQGNQTLSVHSSKCQTFLLNHTGLTTILASVSIILPSSSPGQQWGCWETAPCPTNPHRCNGLNPYWLLTQVVSDLIGPILFFCKQICIYAFQDLSKHADKPYTYIYNTSNYISLTLSRHMCGILSDTTKLQHNVNLRQKS